MLNDNSILRTENLAAGYNNNLVLSNVSFSLEKSEILVIIGQNGSGKSTLLKSLSGLVNPVSGFVWLKNQHGNNIKPHQLIKRGFSFFTQGGLIMPDLTVQEHLCLAAAHNPGKLQKTTLDSTFAEFSNLKEMQTQRAGNLSGGERQILSLAILSMQQTDTWFLDEPTAGLSPDLVNLTTDFLFRKNREGITMLLVEHNMEVAFQLATHITIAKEGTLSPKFNRHQFTKADFLDNFVYN